jgi:nicotinamidase-related amidase
MTTALVIIDMQMMMQHRIDTGRDCVNPAASARVAELADAFRRRQWPIVHIGERARHVQQTSVTWTKCEHPIRQHPI